MIDAIQASLPELPDAKRERFVSEYGLPEADADLLTSEKPLSEWFEDAVKLGGQPKTVANWIMGDLMKLLNAENRTIEECPLEPARLVDMLKLIGEGTISGKIAKTVFGEMYRTTKTAGEIVQEKGLVQISDSGELEKAVEDVIAGHPERNREVQGRGRKTSGLFRRPGHEIDQGQGKPSDGK